jgi:DNA-binding IscR family transcriptional regulator
MSTDATSTKPGLGAVALMLLAVLPDLPDDQWLALDDVQAAADAYEVPATNVAAVMRELRRRGFVRARPDLVEAWQLTPAGVDAAAPLRSA